MIHEDRRRACSFGDDPLQYDRARPSYPPALIDDLIAESPRRVLDIGCGTGIAGRLFLERGCEVVGVEPDSRMAEVASDRGITVDVATFEDWQPSPDRFDLAVSGQAWHWVDPSVGPPKVASVLNVDAALALFWNLGVFEPQVAAQLDDIYGRVAPTLRHDSVALGTLQIHPHATATLIALSGNFETPEIRTYKWKQEYSRDEWLDQLPTHSDHRTLDPERLADLLDAIGTTIDQFGGTIVSHFTTTLVLARRQP